MSGVWGETKPFDDNSIVRNTTEEWEIERIALLNKMRDERLRAESEAEERELIDLSHERIYPRRNVATLCRPSQETLLCSK